MISRSTPSRDDIHVAAAEVLKEYPGSWQLVQRSGDPTTQLIAAADRHRADLIVVGHRGHSELIGLMLGSVASRSRAPLPHGCARREDRTLTRSPSVKERHTLSRSRPR